MVKINHALHFITEVDETHPVGMQILSLTKEMQKTMLEGMLKELLIPVLEPTISEINENGSFAILKVVK
jgi:hypothetical protein